MKNNTIPKIIELVKNKFNILDGFDCNPIDKDHQKRLYQLDGVSEVTKEDESYLIYDCSKSNNEFVFEDYAGIDEKKSVFTIPVMVFSDWTDERKKFNEANSKLTDFKSRKKLIEFFEKKISIYTDLKEVLSLNVTEEGINYLEYKVQSEEDENISGYVYNMTLYELKKIFNVTGRDLFRKNVRNGLNGNITGRKIKEDFKDYMRVFIYSKLIEKISNQDPKLVSEYLTDFKNQFMIDDEKLKNRKPEKFWFYHNGVTIFSFDSDKFIRMGSTIQINPKKVSVINGAQTLTNFYIGLEEIDIELRGLTQDIGPEAFQEEIKNFLINIIKNVEENIILKTIFINGTEDNVEPITFGLNTQIPIQETAIIANSVEVAEINQILNKNKITILKDGENIVAGIGLTVRDFAKQYLVIENKPGKSKNLNKNHIKQEIEVAKIKIAEDEKKYSTGIEKLVLIDDWWKNNRNLKSDENLLALQSYGKNYFESYVLNQTVESDEIDLDQLGILYDNFLKEFSKLSENKLDAKDFKTDVLYEKYLKVSKISEKTDIVHSKWDDTEGLKRYIIENKENNYTSRYLIMQYLEDNKINIPDFRVIAMMNEKVMEAYPFSNKTFDELFQGDEYKNSIFKKYKDSRFYKDINKNFPVFVIKWKDSERTKIEELLYFEKFSFSTFDTEAKVVYDRTVEAFKKGDSLMFTKSSENLGFHIRPKAINKQDTFEFSDGKLITKRTFWANKTTIEVLLVKLAKKTIF